MIGTVPRAALFLRSLDHYQTLCIMLYNVNHMRGGDMSDDQFYTVKHAAEYLGVSSGTIRRWDSGGKLVAQRHPVNRYRVYHVKDLEEIRKELSQGGTRYVPAEVRRL